MSGNTAIEEILETLTGFSQYTTNAEGEFVPIKWRGSPVLAKATQSIKALITNRSAEAYNEGFKDGYIDGGISGLTYDERELTKLKGE